MKADCSARGTKTCFAVRNSSGAGGYRKKQHLGNSRGMDGKTQSI